MTRETMRKLVCRYIYKSEYNPDTFRKTNWKEIMRQIQNEPGEKQVRLLNENKVNFVRQEYILLNETMKYIQDMMLQLETKHEKWLVDNNGVFRYRNYKSFRFSELQKYKNWTSRAPIIGTQEVKKIDFKSSDFRNTVKIM